MPVTSDDLRRHFLAAWGADTCYPDLSEEWTSDNPSRDQCGMTALVVQDILGGELILAEVHVDGAKVGHHYWNRLPDGVEIDLTRSQFRRGEQISNPRVVERLYGSFTREEAYTLFRSRVLSRLE
jgi:hypothetical protein